MNLMLSVESKEKYLKNEKVLDNTPVTSIDDIQILLFCNIIDLI